jgi:hypothetical protein
MALERMSVQERGIRIMVRREGWVREVRKQVPAG